MKWLVSLVMVSLGQAESPGQTKWDPGGQAGILLRSTWPTAARHWSYWHQH